MNQPKFKMGDKVRVNSLVVGKIIAIRLTDNGYKYDIVVLPIRANGKTIGGGIPEELLDLYTEPKPKKLYAWANSVGDIRFTKEERLLALGNFNYERAPEYDIEYHMEGK